MIQNMLQLIVGTHCFSSLAYASGVDAGCAAPPPSSWKGRGVSD